MTPTELLFEKFLLGHTICTDSRKIQPNCIFFALKGDKFNGNAFAANALEQGALLAVIDESNYQVSQQYILVEDVLITLQALAHLYRKYLGIPVVAVGGSNGKTTTKELIHRVLNKKYRTFATQGNLNNHIGVPLSLLSIPHDTQIAVIEMGANHLQETALLCQMAAPTHGVITNAGLDHLEGFGSLEGVIQAHNEMYQYLFGHQGVVFLNTLAPHLTDMLVDYPQERLITYPQAGNTFEIELVNAQWFLQLKTPETGLIETQLIGKYNFHNLATALCIGAYFKVPASMCMEAIASYQPSNNRSQVLKTERNQLILDAYNANPSSMKEAIENFAEIEASKKAVILGDMAELGPFSTQEHINIGKLISEKGFDLIVLYGQHMQHALPYNPRAYYFSDKFSLHTWLSDTKLSQYHILIKGSRSASLETAMGFL